MKLGTSGWKNCESLSNGECVLSDEDNLACNNLTKKPFGESCDCDDCKNTCDYGGLNTGHTNIICICDGLILVGSNGLDVFITRRRKRSIEDMVSLMAYNISSLFSFPCM
jgi:hypothetical protein